MSKKVFDNLVDGGASSPATATPTSFFLNCKQFRSQKLQSCDFSSRKWDFLQKNQHRGRRTRRRPRLKCERVLTLSRSPGVFRQSEAAFGTNRRRLLLVIHVQCATAIAQGRPWVRGGMRASRPTVMRYGRTIAIRRDEGIPPCGTGRRSELCRAKNAFLYNSVSPWWKNVNQFLPKYLWNGATFFA